MTGSYIQRTGKLIAIDEQGALISVPRESSCCACKSRSVCATGALQVSAEHQIRLPAEVFLADTVAGDNLRFEMPASGLARLIGLAYVIPAVLMLIGAAAGQQFGAGSEMAAIGGALAGLGIGCMLLRRYDAHPVNSGLLPRVEGWSDRLSRQQNEPAGHCESD